MKKTAQLLDYVFLLRPTLFYPIWTFFLTGLWGAHKMAADRSVLTLRFAPFWSVSALTLLMGSIYILNQIQDIETDRTNNKLFFLAHGIISVRAAYVEALILAVVGLSAAFMIDIRIGVDCAVLFVLGWLYSFPPARWKNRPFLGLVSNGLLAFFCYSIGWIAGGAKGIFRLHMAAYFFACSAVYLNTTLPDIEGDRKTGKMTVAVRFGQKATILSAVVLEAGTMALAFAFHDWILFFAGLAVFPLYFASAFRQTLSMAVLATKLSVLSLTVAVCVAFPVYLIAVVFVFFFSRWYYKKRFDIDYPNFKTS